MADDPSSFLHRWSRRKHEATRPIPAPDEPLPPAAAPAVVAPVEPPASAPVEPPPLPPIESLTLASDFKPFLSPEVEETVKRAALRKLFEDPHFNVMDGLDIYIDDYSKPDPLPEGLLEKLADVYKTLEEKAAEAAPPDAAVAAAEPQPAADETSTNVEQDPDERQG